MANAATQQGGNLRLSKAQVRKQSLQNRVKGTSAHGRQQILATEGQRAKAVMSHPAFKVRLYRRVYANTAFVGTLVRSNSPLL